MSERSEQSAYLEAYRGAARPDAAARARMWEGLARRAAAGELATIDDDDDDDDGPPAVAPVRRRAAAFVALGLSSAAAVMIGWAASSWWASERADDDDASAAVFSERSATPQASTSAAPAVAVDPLAPVAAPSAPASLPTAAVVVDDAPPAAASKRPRRRSPTAEREPEAAIEPSISAAEIAVLRRAQSLVADDPRAAMAVLADHRDRWPHSSLAAERDVARLAAMCSAGDRDAARRGVAGFEREHPDSPLLPRVRGICSER